jgi:hypothetical protein
MDRKNTLQTFDFENQSVLDNQIQPIAAIELDALVFHGKRQLSLKTDPAKMELMTKALFVR